MLTIERIRELLSYDETTGVFRWKVTRCTAKAGQPAGSLNEAGGYLRISIDSRLYAAHRLAWFLVYESWPQQELDHINHNRTDNRISNLRDVSKTLNQQNRRGAQCDNISGLMGVTTDRRCKSSYSANIRVNNKRIHLGTFNTAEAAHAAYIEAKKLYHSHARIIGSPL